MIDEIRAMCEQYGMKEEQGFCVRYTFENDKDISFHNGNLIGKKSEALQIVRAVRGGDK